MSKAERSWIIAWAALQGIGLWLLHEWLLSLPGTGPYLSVIWPLYAGVIILPSTLMLLSKYRQDKYLWIMVTGFTLLISAAASYTGYQAWVVDLPLHRTGQAGFLLGAMAFISWFVLLPFAEHQLSQGNWCSNYSLLFASAWRNCVKLALAAVFTGVFWILLFLLAGLFKVLNVALFMDLFTSRIFAYPVTAIVFGIGISLYAAKEEALVGIYRASLNILGWLLPMVSFILILFLLALPFQGLTLLWKTGYATSLILVLLACTIFLFNAAWQDASGEQRFPRWLLRFIGIGLLAMPVYIALCAYSLGLRVSQYGWTVDRVWAALVVVLAAIYALGYAWVVLKRQAVWMAGVRQVNILAALSVVVLLLLTLTPVLDPVRLSVNSQVARLMSGKLAAYDFDFEYLRLNGKRYGNAVLQQLSKNTIHPDAVLIQQKAEAALTVEYRTFTSSEGKEHQLTQEQLFKQWRPYPRGTELDAEFVDYLLDNPSVRPTCSEAEPCPVLSVDLDGDGRNEWIMLMSYIGKIYSIENGRWSLAGSLYGDGIYNLMENRFPAQAAILTRPARWKELWIGDVRLYSNDN
ncbi:protein of unknown function [Methylobacillus rhizosphaerae]|uniref:DUF4153 domain-containing protein n=1 Tax=Methylobacillus rhizosphaerae TaxID=551994 RepID=A0A239B2I4_9PROT|nr:DUF4153 domain-containing protein [Methylobacillus rhizosphaerae]SNS02155.1 protein of unknown function [Methylobacillus rhizosphaerae]